MPRRLAALALPALLAGCISATALVPRPPEGYQAARFVQTVRLDQTLVTIEFPAGTVLVADRRRESDGAQLWCGTTLIVDALTRVGMHVCHLLDGDRIVLMADRGGSAPRDLPPGSIEMIRLR